MKYLQENYFRNRTLFRYDVICSLFCFVDERRCKTIKCKNVVGESGIPQEISKKHRQTHKLSLMNGEITFGWIKSSIFSSKTWTLFGH